MHEITQHSTHTPHLVATAMQLHPWTLPDIACAMLHLVNTGCPWPEGQRHASNNEQSQAQTQTQTQTQAPLALGRLARLLWRLVMGLKEETGGVEVD